MKPTEVLALKSDTVTRSHADHREPHQRPGPDREPVQQRGRAGAGRRNPGAVARRGRSCPREADLQTAAMLEIVRSEGRPVRQPGRRRRQARRRAAAEYEAGAGASRATERNGELVPGESGLRSSRAATCAMRGRRRTSSASGRPISRSARTPRAVSAASPRPTSATVWRSFSTTRFAALRPFRRALRTRAASPAQAASRKPPTWRWCCAPVRCRPASSTCRRTHRRAVAGRRFHPAGHHGRPGRPGRLSFVVMLVYYKGSGVNAVLALILNAVILHRPYWLTSKPS